MAGSWRQKAQYQDEYRQLADFLTSVNESSGSPGQPRDATALPGQGTATHLTECTRQDAADSTCWLDPDDRLMGAEAKPDHADCGRGRLRAGRGMGADDPRRQVRGINAVDQARMPTFARPVDSSRLSDPDGTPTRSSTTGWRPAGQFLLQVGRPGPRPAGRQVRRDRGQRTVPGGGGDRAPPPGRPPTGTGAPRRPRTRAGRASTGARSRRPRSTARSTRGGKRDARVGPGARRHAAMTAIRTGRGSVTSRRSRVGGDSAATSGCRAPGTGELAPSRPGRSGAGSAIVEQLPDARSCPAQAALYNLQLASGNTPPSEGVIINANGQIVTQAVGYGDDHYLPFNLKNLKALKGGEYIRTRSVGGLTSEDIYTGLISRGSPGHGGLALGHVHHGVRAGLPGRASAQRQGRADDPALRAAPGRGAVRAGGAAAGPEALEGRDQGGGADRRVLRHRAQGGPAGRDRGPD